ncbi:MAG TPA: PadR family transcriptional regulator [Isosphaeraceae bacterium]|nr:PadR family transcriptional regulator [Isosphaeraceae bacterium]
MGELLIKMFFGGFVRMHVLYHAVKEPVFGVEMMEELARHGYDVGPGTLYPILHQLEEAGYLRVHTEVVAGKQRKYYRATPEGGRALEDAKAKLRELVKEVLQDDPPSPSIRSKGRSPGPTPSPERTEP